MNYLAHSFLSFSNEQIVGQFLEDYVKNNQRHLLPKEIQKGIVLHRAIDTFTDAHPSIHKAKIIFSPLVRLYSGAFIDVCMDYFLANDMSVHSKEGWKSHSEKVYAALNEYKDYFPIEFHRKLEKMEADDWLYNYREDWGIKFSIQNVLNKAKYLEKDIPVFEAFLQNKEKLQECYDELFPDLYQHIQQLNTQI